MRDYGKVHSSFWTSQTIKDLSEDGRTLALYLMTSPHTTIAGVFRLPDGYACEDIGWTAERVKEGFANLHANGFATRCERTKWVWIRKHLVWNPPENPNQTKSAAKCAATIPTDCSWRLDFLGENGPGLGFGDEFEPKGCGTLAEPFRNQEPEQEQEQESSEAKASVSAARTKRPTIPCPYEAIVEAYHTALPAMPRVRMLDGPTWTDRQKAMRTLWGWILSSRRADKSRRAETADEALQWIRDYFERATHNDFLMGRTPRSGEHANWRPDFDFLLSKKGMRQVIEKTEAA